MAARFRPEKGHNILIEAANILLGDGVQVSVVFAGHGPTFNATRDAAGVTSAAPHLFFAGHVANTRNLLTECDVLCLPSKSEGLPVVVMEALQEGVPVVATAVGGLPELVHHEINGLLVTPGSARDLANALMRLAFDNDLLSALSVGAAESGLSLSNAELGRTVEAIYHHVLESS
jgi:glycosyltransferase involved in cell wall biosynthesis